MSSKARGGLSKREFAAQQALKPKSILGRVNQKLAVRQAISQPNMFPTDTGPAKWTNQQLSGMMANAQVNKAYDQQMIARGKQLDQEARMTAKEKELQANINKNIDEIKFRAENPILGTSQDALRRYQSPKLSEVEKLPTKSFSQSIEDWRKSTGPKIADYFGNLEKASPKEKINILGDTFQKIRSKIRPLLGGMTDEERQKAQEEWDKQPLEWKKKHLGESPGMKEYTNVVMGMIGGEGIDNIASKEIKAASVKIGDEVFNAATHEDAWLKAQQAGHDIATVKGVEGFTDLNDKFLTRTQTKALTGKSQSHQFEQLNKLRDEKQAAQYQKDITETGAKAHMEENKANAIERGKQIEKERVAEDLKQQFGTVKTFSEPKEEGALVKARKAKIEGNFKNEIDQQNKRLQIIDQVRKEKEPVQAEFFSKDKYYKDLESALQKGVKNAKENPDPFSNLPKGEKPPKVKPQKLTPEEENKLIVKTARDARYNMFEIESRLKIGKANLDYKLNKLLGGNLKENSLAKQLIQEPERADEILAQSKNPDKLIQAQKAYKDYTDMAYKLRDISGSEPIGYLTNYLHTGWDLSKPEDLARYKELERRLPKNYKGGYTKPKVFKTESEGIAAGFTPKFKTLKSSADDLHQQLLKSLPNDALVNTIRESPISEHISGTDFWGSRKPNIPGLQGTYVTEKLYKELKQLEPSVLRNTPIIKQLLGAGRNIKDMLLSLAHFHSLNISKKVLGYTGNPWEVARGYKAFFSPGYMNKEIELATKDGLAEYMSKAGYNTFSYQGLEGTAVSRGKYNPLNILHKATFDRQITLYNMDIARAAMNKGIAPESEVGRALAEQVNGLLGSINYKTMKGKIISNPEIRALGDGLLLAPGFSGGKIKNIKSALNLTKWSPANNAARRAIIGDIIVTGIIVELGQRVVTGKFHDPNEMLQKDLFDPQFDLPWKTKTGRGSVAKTPGTDFSDILRAIQDPTHALISRGSPMVSIGTQEMSGKDYYGNPLVSQDSPHPEIDKQVAIAKGYLPIGAQQVGKTLEGKQTMGTTALNIAGFRVGSDMSQEEKNTRNMWNKIMPPSKLTQDEIDKKVQDAINSGKPFKQKTPEQWKKEGDFLTALDKTKADSPERTQLIQDYMASLPESERKSLNFKLSSLGQISTKGVSLSDDVIAGKPIYEKVQELRKSGDENALNEYAQQIGEKGMKQYKAAEKSIKSSETRDFNTKNATKIQKIADVYKSGDVQQAELMLQDFSEEDRQMVINKVKALLKK